MLHTKFHENRLASSGEEDFLRVIILSNYDGLKSLMLHIPSFVEIRPPVLEKKIFEWFLPYMGVAAILVM